MNVANRTLSQDSAVAQTSVVQPERRIVVAATFTAEPLEESLVFWVEQLRLPFKAQFAPFGQVFQELLDRSSPLSSNEHGFNVVLVRLEDLGGFDNPAASEQLRCRLDELVSSVKTSRAASVSPLLMGICPPSERLRGDGAAYEQYRRLEAYFCTALMMIIGVRVLRYQDVLARYPTTIDATPGMEAHGHIPYGRGFYTAMGASIIRVLHSLQGSPAKVLVLDCDHTLWKGVSAEDGALGVVVDSPRRAIQEFALRQRAAGVLVCLCSKNVEEDVMSVLDQHPDMVLRREHVTAMRINWDPKSVNLRALAKQLNLGLESFVFLDDSAVECAEVRARVPEVLALTLPEDTCHIPSFLDHIWAFDGSTRTKEDTKRAEFYRQEVDRNMLRQSAISFGDFIAGLALEISIFTPAPEQVARVAQLTQRTNQFNNTTIRRKENEVRQLVGAEQCIAVDVRDRFGDYGLVGIVIFSSRSEALVADSLIMSCRALGRGVEHRLVADLGQRALTRNLRNVEIPYVPTLKNQPMLRFLQSLGADVEDIADGSRVFRLQASHAAQVVFMPDESAETIVEADEADARPGSTQPASLSRRLPSDEWQEIFSELSTVENILQRIDNKRMRPRPPMRSAFVAPRDELEGKLARMWANALGVDRVGIYDDFFELGGTSLQAVVIQNSLQEDLNYQFSSVIVFESPTVAEVADRIHTILWVSQSKSTSQVDSDRKVIEL